MAIINKDPARFEDNQAYRYSMEGKRLLSTSSNGSSERYSVVPPVPGKDITIQGLLYVSDGALATKIYICQERSRLLQLDGLLFF